MYAGKRAIPNHATPLNCSTKFAFFKPRQSCQACTLHLSASPGPVTDLSGFVPVMVEMVYLPPQAFSDVPGKKKKKKAAPGMG